MLKKIDQFIRNFPVGLNDGEVANAMSYTIYETRDRIFEELNEKRARVGHPFCPQDHLDILESILEKGIKEEWIIMKTREELEVRNVSPVLMSTSAKESEEDADHCKTLEEIDYCLSDEGILKRVQSVDATIVSLEELDESDWAVIDGWENNYSKRKKEVQEKGNRTFYKLSQIDGRKKEINKTKLRLWYKPDFSLI